MKIREKLFTQKGVGHWNRLSKEVVTALNLTEFKKLLEMVV